MTPKLDNDEQNFFIEPEIEKNYEVARLERKTDKKVHEHLA